MKGSGILSVVNSSNVVERNTPEVLINIHRSQCRPVSVDPDSAPPRQSRLNSASRQMTIFYVGQANVFDEVHPNKRYGELTKQRLDRAILTFFQHFRKSYVGDQAMHSSKQLYARLSELLGLHDHLLLLNVIVGKIATNLKCYSKSEEVIDHTLTLFLELASGYMTGKLL